MNVKNKLKSVISLALVMVMVLGYVPSYASGVNPSDYDLQDEVKETNEDSLVESEDVSDEALSDDVEESKEAEEDLPEITNVDESINAQAELYNDGDDSTTTIVFDINYKNFGASWTEGNANDNSPIEFKLKKGESLPFYKTPQVGYKSGYTFMGWATEEEGQNNNPDTNNYQLGFRREKNDSLVQFYQFAINTPYSKGDIKYVPIFKNDNLFNVQDYYCSPTEISVEGLKACALGGLNISETGLYFYGTASSCGALQVQVTDFNNNSNLNIINASSNYDVLYPCYFSKVSNLDWVNQDFINEFATSAQMQNGMPIFVRGAGTATFVSAAYSFKGTKLAKKKITILPTNVTDIETEAKKKNSNYSIIKQPTEGQNWYVGGKGCKPTASNVVINKNGTTMYNLDFLRDCIDTSYTFADNKTYLGNNKVTISFKGLLKGNARTINYKGVERPDKLLLHLVPASGVEGYEYRVMQDLSTGSIYYQKYIKEFDAWIRLSDGEVPTFLSTPEIKVKAGEKMENVDNTKFDVEDSIVHAPSNKFGILADDVEHHKGRVEGEYGTDMQNEEIPFEYNIDPDYSFGGLSEEEERQLKVETNLSKGFLRIKSKSAFTVKFRSKAKWDGTLYYNKGSNSSSNSSISWSTASLSTAKSGLSATKPTGDDYYYLNLKGANITTFAKDDNGQSAGNLGMSLEGGSSGVYIEGDILSLLSSTDAMNKNRDYIASSAAFTSLFEGWTYLKNTPTLSLYQPSFNYSTGYGYGLYEYMFKNCTSLTSAEDIHVKNFDEFSYGDCHGMFEGCTSLLTPPNIYAVGMSNSTFADIFKNSGIVLKTQKEGLYTKEWSVKVTEAGIFTANTKYYVYEDPYTPITVAADGDKCVTFKSKNPFSIRFGSDTVIEGESYRALEYAAGDPTKVEFAVWDLKSLTTKKDAVKVGDYYKISIRGTGIKKYNQKYQSNGLIIDTDVNGSVECIGDVKDLLNCRKSEADMAENALSKFFMNNNAIWKTPTFKQQNISNYAYERMFEGCGYLTDVASLEATTVSQGAYYEMFKNCVSLKNQPEIKAKVFKVAACFGMFDGDYLIRVPQNLTFESADLQAFKYMYRNTSVIIKSTSSGKFTKEWSINSDNCLDMFENTESDVTTPSANTKYYTYATAIPTITEKAYDQDVSSNACLTFRALDSFNLSIDIYAEWNGTVQYCKGNPNGTYQNISSAKSYEAEKYDGYYMISLRGDNTTYFRANTKNGSAISFYGNASQIEIVGDLGSLVSYTKVKNNQKITNLSDNAFQYLFQNATELVNTPTFKYIDKIPSNGFLGTFKGCSSIMQAATIGASVILDNGCKSMFENCTNLKSPANMQAYLFRSGAMSNMYDGTSVAFKEASEGKFTRQWKIDPEYIGSNWNTNYLNFEKTYYVMTLELLDVNYQLPSQVEFNYSATEYSPKVTVTEPNNATVLYSVGNENNYSAKVPSFRNANGNGQKVYFKISAFGYKETKGTFTVKINKANIPTPTFTNLTGYIFNPSKEYAPTMSVNLLGTDTWSAKYTYDGTVYTTIPKFKDAGEYKVSYEILGAGDGLGNYNAKTGSYTFVIGKSSEENCYSIGKTATTSYNGEAQFKYDNITVFKEDYVKNMRMKFSRTETGTYTDTISDLVNPGTYKIWVIISSDNLVDFKASYDFVIKNADFKLIGINETNSYVSIPYDDTEHEFPVKVEEPLYGGATPKVMYSTSGASGPWTATVPKFKEEGTSKRIDFIINANNYNELKGYFTAAISKNNGFGNVTVTVNGKSICDNSRDTHTIYFDANGGTLDNSGTIIEAYRLSNQNTTSPLPIMRYTYDSNLSESYEFVEANNKEKRLNDELPYYYMPTVAYKSGYTFCGWGLAEQVDTLDPDSSRSNVGDAVVDFYYQRKDFKYSDTTTNASDVHYKAIWRKNDLVNTNEYTFYKTSQSFHGLYNGDQLAQETNSTLTSWSLSATDIGLIDASIDTKGNGNNLEEFVHEISYNEDVIGTDVYNNPDYQDILAGKTAMYGVPKKVKSVGTTTIVNVAKNYVAKIELTVLPTSYTYLSDERKDEVNTHPKEGEERYNPALSYINLDYKDKTDDTLGISASSSIVNDDDLEIYSVEDVAKWYTIEYKDITNNSRVYSSDNTTREIQATVKYSGLLTGERKISFTTKPHTYSTSLQILNESTNTWETVIKGANFKDSSSTITKNKVVPMDIDFTTVNSLEDLPPIRLKVEDEVVDPSLYTLKLQASSSDNNGKPPTLTAAGKYNTPVQADGFYDVPLIAGQAVVKFNAKFVDKNGKNWGGSWSKTNTSDNAVKVYDIRQLGELSFDDIPKFPYLNGYTCIGWGAEEFVKENNPDVSDYDMGTMRNDSYARVPFINMMGNSFKLNEKNVVGVINYYPIYKKNDLFNQDDYKFSKTSVTIDPLKKVGAILSDGSHADYGNTITNASLTGVPAELFLFRTGMNSQLQNDSAFYLNREIVSSDQNVFIYVNSLNDIDNEMYSKYLDGHAVLEEIALNAFVEGQSIGVCTGAGTATMVQIQKDADKKLHLAKLDITVKSTDVSTLETLGKAVDSNYQLIKQPKNNQNWYVGGKGCEPVAPNIVFGSAGNLNLNADLLSKSFEATYTFANSTTKLGKNSVKVSFKNLLSGTAKTISYNGVERKDKLVLLMYSYYIDEEGNETINTYKVTLNQVSKAMEIRKYNYELDDWVELQNGEGIQFNDYPQLIVCLEKSLNNYDDFDLEELSQIKDSTANLSSQFEALQKEISQQEANSLMESLGISAGVNADDAIDGDYVPDNYSIDLSGKGGTDYQCEGTSLPLPYEIVSPNQSIKYTVNSYKGEYDGKEHTIDFKLTFPDNAVVKYRNGTSGSYNLNTLPKFKNVGKYTVGFEITAEGYTTIQGEGTVEITKATFGNVETYLDGVKIANKDHLAKYTFSGHTFEAKTTDERLTDLKIYYYVDTDNINPMEVIQMFNEGKLSTNKPVIKNKGNYRIYYIASDPNFEAKGDYQNIEIYTDGMEEFIAHYPYSGNFDGKEHQIITDITLPANTYQVFYADGKADTAEFNLTEPPKYKKAGEYTTSVKVVSEGYDDFIFEEQVIIHKAKANVKVKMDSFFADMTYKKPSNPSVLSPTGSKYTVLWKEYAFEEYREMPGVREPGTYTWFYKIVFEDEDYNESVTGLEGTVTFTIEGSNDLVYAKEDTVVSFNGKEEHRPNVSVGGYNVFDLMLDDNNRFELLINSVEAVYVRESVINEFEDIYNANDANGEEIRSEYKSFDNWLKEKIAVVITENPYRETITYPMEIDTNDLDKISYSAYKRQVGKYYVFFNIKSQLYAPVYDYVKFEIEDYNLSFAYQDEEIKYTGNPIYPKWPDVYINGNKKELIQDNGLTHINMYYSYEEEPDDYNILAYADIPPKEYIENEGLESFKDVVEYEGEITEPGNYNIKFEVHYNGNTHSSDVYKFTILQPDAIQVVLKAEGVDTVYDGAAHSPNIELNTTDCPNAYVKYSLDGINYELDTVSFTDSIFTDVYYKVFVPDMPYVNSGLEGKVKISIQKAMPEGTIEGYEGPYDGNNHEPKLTITKPTDYDIEYYVNGEKVDSKPSLKNTGSYSIKCIVKNNNYMDLVLETTINIGKPVVLYDVEGYDGEFDGKEHSIKITITNNIDCDITYSLTEDGTYTPTNPAFKDASDNEYDVYYKISPKDENYSEITGLEKIIIKKAVIKAPIISNNSYVYDGEPHLGTIGVSLVEGEEYKVQYLDSATNTYKDTPPVYIDAGTYTVKYKITSKNYRDFTGQYTLTINKAAMEYNVPTDSGAEFIYDGNEHSASITMVKPLNASVTYSSTKLGTYTTQAPKFVNANEKGYDVYYKITADNYVSVENSYKITIKKRNMQAPTISNTEYDFDGQYKRVSITPNVIEGTTYKIYYAEKEEGPYAENHPSCLNAGVYPIWYKITSDNYNDYISSCQLKINYLNMPNPQISNTTHTYDGTAKKPTIYVQLVDNLAPTVLLSLNGTDYVEESKFQVVNANSYTIYYKLEAGNYNTKTGSFNFTINKINIDDKYIKVTPVNTAYDGTAKSGKVEILPGLTGNPTVKVEYKTANSAYSTTPPTRTLPGTTTVTYRLTADNYIEKTGNFDITITEGKIEYTLPTNDITYTGKAQKTNPIVVTTPNSGATVSYKIGANGQYSTEVPSVTNANTSGYDIYYRIQAEGYTTVENSYKVVVKKAKITSSMINVTNNVVTYNGENRKADITANLLANETATITYSTSQNGTYAAHPNYKNASTTGYTIWYKVTNANYEDFKSSYTLTIEKATIKASDVVAADINAVYDGTAKTSTVSVKNIISGNTPTIKYSTTGAANSYTLTSPPSVKNVSDSKDIYYQIVVPNYNTYTGKYKATITPAKILESNIKVVTKTEKYDKTAKTGLEGGKITVEGLAGGVTYTVKYKAQGASAYSTTVPTLTNAGSLKVEFTVEAANYETYTGSYTIVVTESGIEVETNDIVVDYNGKAVDISKAVSVKNVDKYTVKYALNDNSSSYSTSYPSIINASASAVTVYYIVSAENYTSYKGTFSVKVNKIAIDASNITVSSNTGTYNASPVKGAVSVKNLISGNTYTVKYSTSKSGTYKALSSFEGYTNATTGSKVYYKIESNNYVTYEGEYNVVIDKASLEGKVTATSTPRTYDKTAKVGANITVGTLLGNPSVVVEYRTNSSEPYSTTQPTYKNAGTYKLFYRVSAGNNYTAIENSIDVVINKATLNVTYDKEVEKVYNSKQQSQDIVVGTDENYDIAYTLEDLTGRTSEIGVAVPYGANQPKPTLSGRYKVGFTITSDNYEEYTGDYTIIINKANLEVSYEESQSVGHDKSAHSIIAPTFVKLNNSDEVVVKYQVGSSDEYTTTVPSFTEVGEYTVNFRIDSLDYNEYTGTIKFTVIKTEPDVYTFDDKYIKVTPVNTVYDGTAKSGKVEILPGLTGNPTVKVEYKTANSAYSTTPPSRTLPGTTTVTYRLTADNYIEKIGNFDITITEGKIEYTLPTNDITYTGKAQKTNPIVVTTPNSGATVSYKIGANGQYSTEVPSVTNANTSGYDIYYRIQAEGYTTVENSYKVVVKKAKITSSMIQIANNVVTYNGENRKADITANLLANETATITYSTSQNGTYGAHPNYKNASTTGYTIWYKVTNANYEDFKSSYTLTIEKATIKASDVVAADINAVYDGTAKTSTVSVKNIISGNTPTIKYSTTGAANSYTLTSPPSVKNVSDSKDIYYQIVVPNYNTYTGKYKATITPAKILESNIKVVTKTEKYDKTAKTGLEGGKITVEGLAGGVTYTVKYKAQGASAYSTTVPTLTNAGSLKVEFTVEAANYETYTGSYTIVVTESDIEVETNDIVVDYNGKAVDIRSGIEIKDITNYVIKYSLDNDAYTETQPVIKDATDGAVTVYFTVESGNYTPYKGAIRVTVRKKELTENNIKVSNNEGVFNGTAYKGLVEVEKTIAGNTFTVTYSKVKNSQYVSLDKFEGYVNATSGSKVYYRIESNNYETYEGEFDLVINRLSLKEYVVVNTKTEKYDGNAKLGATISVKELLGNPEVVYEFKTDEDAPYGRIQPTYTNAGTYILYFRVSAGENYAPYESQCQVVISKSDINVTYEGIIERTYNGNMQGQDIVIKTEGDYEVEYSLEDITGRYGEAGTVIPYGKVQPKPILSGRYKISFVVSSNNSEPYEGYYTLIINKADFDVNYNKTQSVKYDGKEHTIEGPIFNTASEDDEVKLEYSVDGKEYTESVPKFTEVGTHIISFRITGVEYNEYTGEIVYSVIDKEPEFKVTNYEGEYDGKEHGIEVEVTYPKEGYKVYFGATSTDCTHESLGYKLPGEYTVYFIIKVDGVQVGGVYEGKVTITPKEILYTNPSTLNTRYDGKAHSIDIREHLVDPKDAVVMYRLSGEEDYSEVVPEFVEEGTYKVEFRIEREGYATTEDIYTVTISANRFAISIFDIDGKTMTKYSQYKALISEIEYPSEEEMKVEGKIFLGWCVKVVNSNNTSTQIDVTHTMLKNLDNVISGPLEIYPVYIDDFTKDIDEDNLKDIDSNIEDLDFEYTYVDSQGKVYNEKPTIPGIYEVFVKIKLGEEVLKNEKVKDININDDDEKPTYNNIPIYRLYNPISGEHLFTSKVGEYNKLPASGWIQEDKTFDAYAEDNKPEDAIEVYRLFNPSGFGGKGDHHYTKSKGEINKLVKAGWSLDFDGKPAFYVAGKISVFKLYDKRTGAHHYTPKTGERNNMEKAGWAYEGEAWTVNGYYSNNGTQRISDENM